MASIEVADVFRQFGPSYLEAFADRLLPSHRRALEDITACRTALMGGHAYTCEDCGQRFYVYHGCRNRSCPACHTHQTQQWLDARTVELLPCPYYHVTVTVPAQLRDVLRSNQSDGYHLLMKAAAEAVIALCRDQRYMGATPAVLAVLHTWTAAIDYHPHVHLLVSGGGIGQDRASWREAKHPFLVPVRALSRLVRGTFHDALKQERPDLEAPLPADVWSRDWVAWCKPWGQGETAVLDYLARYVHRIAITNGRILTIDEHTVTFRYKDRKRQQWRTCTLTGHEFMRRFLQHVLPRGFHKIRYYGLWHCAQRPQRENARRALLLKQAQPALEVRNANSPSVEAASDDTLNVTCPYCGSHHAKLLGPLPPGLAPHAARASPADPC
jgi:Zn finger protein HypA/HybF involved in hydrogenase expression